MNLEKIKNLLKNNKKKSIAILAILILAIAGFVFFNKKNNNSETSNEKPLVKIMTVSKANETVFMETSGTVKPMKSIAVKTLGNGTVTSVLAENGSTVSAGQTLAYLYDEPTETNYASALSAFTTAQNSYNSTIISADKSAQQARLALDQATQSNVSAKFSYNNALDNLINSNQSALNSIYNILNFADSVLGVDGDVKYPGLKEAFSIKNADLKNKTQGLYSKTKNDYKEISKQTITRDNVKNSTKTIESLTQECKTLMDLVVESLNASVSSQELSQLSLSSIISNATAQQTALSGIIASQIANQNILEKSETGITLSDLALKSAETGLANAEQAKILTVNGAESALRGARTSFELANISKSRLAITAPFNGVISKKSVEVGDQVNIGQQLFEVAVVNYVKIEVAVPAESKDLLTIGDEISINENLKGTLTRIDPIADPVSKKIQVEIGFDNSKSELIAENFANIKIPLKKLSQQDGIFIIPLSAMELDSEKATVKIVKDGKIQSKNVEYMEILNDKVAIKNGLSEGDELVIENGKMLSDGTNVEIEK